MQMPARTKTLAPLGEEEDLWNDISKKKREALDRKRRRRPVNQTNSMLSENPWSESEAIFSDDSLPKYSQRAAAHRQHRNQEKLRGTTRLPSVPSKRTPRFDQAPSVDRDAMAERDLVPAPMILPSVENHARSSGPFRQVTPRSADAQDTRRHNKPRSLRALSRSRFGDVTKADTSAIGGTSQRGCTPDAQGANIPAATTMPGSSRSGLACVGCEWKQHDQERSSDDESESPGQSRDPSSSGSERNSERYWRKPLPPAGLPERPVASKSLQSLPRKPAFRTELSHKSSCECDDKNPSSAGSDLQVTPAATPKGAFVPPKRVSTSSKFFDPKAPSQS